MKKILFFTMCIIIILNLAACGSSVNNAVIKSPVYPKSISFHDNDSQRAIRENNPVDDSYIESINDFSYTTASKILSGKSTNFSYSPISLYMALSLAGTGANGETQNEIFSALGVRGKDIDFLSKQNSNLFRRLYLDNEIGKLKIANSIWLQKNVDFKDDFISNSVQNFYASSYSVDFSDKSTPRLMSKWISDNTNGVLSPKMDLAEEQIMSIINTIYLKDEWQTSFNKKNTKPDTFYLRDGSEIECDFMNMTYDVHGFVKGDGFTSSSLSLKNAGRMIFILPDKGVSIDDLISTPDKFALLFKKDGGESGKVIFQIPKFSFGNDIDLDDTLKSMGVISAFKLDADFTGITDDIAFISNIRQQTHIAIDEKGVEAAAFTEIRYAGSAPPNEKVAEMILNRPFIFAIKSNNDASLFVGIVNNPTDK